MYQSNSRLLFVIHPAFLICFILAIHIGLCSEKPKQPAWSQPTRFDPDGANADAFLLSSDENTLENEQRATNESLGTPIVISLDVLIMSNVSTFHNFIVSFVKLDIENESNSLKKPVLASTASTIPEVSKEKHFDININLKPLFTPGAESKHYQNVY